MRRVVVTAVGVVSAIGNGLAEFRRALFAGRSGACRLGEVLPHFAEDTAVTIGAPVTHALAAMAERRRGERLHRSEIFAAGAFQQLVDQCGLEVLRDAPVACGVGIGQLFPDGEELFEMAPDRRLGALSKRVERPGGIEPSGRASAVFADYGTVQLRRAFELRGSTTTFVAACAAATQACIQAWEEVRYGGAEVAIGGGHDSLLGTAGVYMMHQLGTLTPTRDPAIGIRAFDVERDGTMLGEGAAYMVFEEHDHALRRGAPILAEVIGHGTSLDGHHLTSPDPSGDGGVRMIEDALAMGGIGPERIDYVNAHGTSTVLNDVVEATIINRALPHEPYVSATKAQVGHLIAACGAVELVACIAALREQRVPPNVNLKRPDPECRLRLPIGDAPAASLEYVLCNSFGFGGQNACMILRR